MRNGSASNVNGDFNSIHNSIQIQFNLFFIYISTSNTIVQIKLKKMMLIPRD